MFSRSSSRWSRWLFGAALFLGPLPALAEEVRDPTPSAPSSSTDSKPPEQEAEETFTLEGVEVVGDRLRGKIPEPTADEEPTGFGTVIVGEDFAGEKVGIAELLLQAPGSRVRRAPGSETLQLRGTSADHTVVLLDGIRMNSLSGGGVDLLTIPSGLIERITVLRGNEGARYGAGALGGAALLSTRPLREGGTETAFSFSTGSFGTYVLDGSLTGGSDALHGLAAVSLNRSEGSYPALFDPTPASDPGDRRSERLDNNDRRSVGVLAKGAARLGGLRVHAMGQGYLGERGLPGTLYWRDNQRRSERRVLAALRAEPVAKGPQLLYGGVELRHDEVAIWGPSFGSVTEQPRVDSSGLPWQTEDTIEFSLGTEAALTSWTLLRVEGRAGGEWLEGPYYGVPSRERLSLSVLDEIYVGKHVTLAPAVRYDRIGHHDGLSPKIGLSVRPLRFLELRANAGRSFRVPTFGELYLVQGPVRPNWRLRPEQGSTVDGGAVIRARNLLVQLSGFYSRTTDLISYEVVNGGLSKPFNFLDAEITGGEVEVVSKPLDWLTVSASYSLARTSNLRDDPRYLGKELPYRPSQRALARIAARRDQVEGFLEGSHQSAQFVNRTNTGELPAQTSFRAGAGYRLFRGTHDFWLSGQIDNALDAQLVDQLGFPQPGRAFYLTLRAAPFGGSGDA